MTHPAPTSQEVDLVDGLTREYLFHHRLCPLRYEGEGCLVVATAPDAHLDALEDIGYAYRREPLPEQMPREEVERCIERLFTRSERRIELAQADQGDHDLTADVRDLANQPPVIRYVNLLVRDAYDVGASDIHLEASREGLSVRFRLDGVLVPAPEPPSQAHQAVVSRIKLLAELDIAERRRPQDGRIRVRLEGRELDLRVSTVPTLLGESVVLRLLDRGGRPAGLSDLGMPSHVESRIRILARRSHGMLLVTGPTGSGKTTTLYAVLELRNASAEKILTVEDPVEYQLPGIAQVPVHRQAGVSFAAALRSILRQDPDVILVGEMRDSETAEVAVQAAMTGHLVLSTVHTNDALGALPRLVDLGIPEYLVCATVEAIVAQRLVRRICNHCTESYEPPPEAVDSLGHEFPSGTEFLRGGGCELCRGTGYRGRLGVFELVEMNEPLREALGRKAPQGELQALARAGGAIPLRADASQKIAAGLTTVEEVLRVIQE